MFTRKGLFALLISLVLVTGIQVFETLYFVEVSYVDNDAFYTVYEEPNLNEDEFAKIELLDYVSTSEEALREFVKHSRNEYYFLQRIFRNEYTIYYDESRESYILYYHNTKHGSISGWIYKGDNSIYIRSEKF